MTSFSPKPIFLRRVPSFGTLRSSRWHTARRKHTQNHETRGCNWLGTGFRAIAISCSVRQRIMARYFSVASLWRLHRILMRSFQRWKSKTSLIESPFPTQSELTSPIACSRPTRRRRPSRSTCITKWPKRHFIQPAFYSFVNWQLSREAQLPFVVLTFCMTSSRRHLSCVHSGFEEQGIEVLQRHAC